MQFAKAVELVGQEFSERISYYACTWWPARSIVEQSIKNRYQVNL